MDKEQFVNQLNPQDILLNQILENMKKHDIPDIAVSPTYGRLLTFLVQISQPNHVLEIGTLAGYSTVCLARGLTQNGRLISLEKNSNNVEIAEEHLQLAGLKEKVEVVNGDAIHILSKFLNEKKSFDFFFIDADKINTLHYLDYVISLGKPGSIVVVDNLWMRGRVFDQSKTGEAVKAMREAHRRLMEDPKFFSTILPSYDGLAVARLQG